MECFGKNSTAVVTKPPPDQEQVKSKARSDNISNFMSQEHRKEEEKLKILLLGTGESGKSTIFKQFKILYGTPKNDDYLRMYGVVVRTNVVTAITKLCELVRYIGYEKHLIEESNIANDDICGMTVKDAYDLIMSHQVDNNATEPLPEISPERLKSDWVGSSHKVNPKANSDAIRCLQLADAIEVLWQSPTIQDAWTQRALRNITDSHATFLRDVKRITSPTYIPMEEDVLKARLRTTHVTVERYRIEGVPFEICDVGGQRSERRKWLNCFTDVNAVIFVAALSEYDQKLAEAKTINRMVEALNLFGSIANNVYFENTPVILFLNKKDIFEEKIQYSDISKVPHFSDYGGPPNDFDSGVLYFIQKFEEQLDDGEFSDNFIHVTNATDTTNMEFVLNAIRMIMMRRDFEYLNIDG